MTPQEPVPQVAEGAFRSAPDTMFFRVGDHVMLTVSSFGDQTADYAVRLAQFVVERLGNR